MVKRATDFIEWLIEVTFDLVGAGIEKLAYWITYPPFAIFRGIKQGVFDAWEYSDREVK